MEEVRIEKARQLGRSGYSTLSLVMPERFKEKEMQVEIHFGALADPLEKQLEGFNISADKIEHFQKDADAITRLVVRGLIPDGAAHQARKKIIRNITTSQGK